MGNEMGNNNTTVLREEESSKLENNEKSPVLESVSAEKTQDHVFRADEDKDGDEKEKRLVPGDPDSLTIGKTENGVHPLNGSDETTLQAKESEEQKDENYVSVQLELSESRGEIHSDGSESGASVEVDHGVQTQTSVTEGEPVNQAKAGDEDELSEPESEAFRNESLETESSEAENCVHENASFEETDEKTVQDESKAQENSVMQEANSEEKERDEDGTSMETHKSSGDEDISETNAEQMIGEKGFIDQEMKLQIPNLEDHADDAPVVAEEQNSEDIVEPIMQEIEHIEKSSVEVQMIDRGSEGREASLRRMSRSRSLPVKHTPRVLTNPLVRPPIDRVSCPSSHNTTLKEGVAENALSVSCVGRNTEQEAAKSDTDRIIEAEPEMRSPSFGSDLRINARTEESSDRTPLLFEDKAETYETRISVEEKTVTLKRSESEKSRKEEFVGLMKKEKERSEEDDQYEGLGDNLSDKKSSSGRERRRSKASLFGTCLCCATVMN